MAQCQGTGRIIAVVNASLSHLRDDSQTKIIQSLKNAKPDASSLHQKQYRVAQVRTTLKRECCTRVNAAVGSNPSLTSCTFCCVHKRPALPYLLLHASPEPQATHIVKPLEQECRLQIAAWDQWCDPGLPQRVCCLRVNTV